MIKKFYTAYNLVSSPNVDPKEELFVIEETTENITDKIKYWNALTTEDGEEIIPIYTQGIIFDNEAQREALHNALCSKSGFKAWGNSGVVASSGESYWFRGRAKGRDNLKLEAELME